MMPAVLFVVVIVAFVGAVPAAADDPCRARGKPIYRVTRSAMRPPPDGEPSPAPFFELAIYATGRWTWLESGEVGSGEAMVRGGCLDADRRRELARALARAQFRIQRKAVVCAGVPKTKIVLEAPRRGKRIETGMPCGPPLDESTAALAACATAVVDGPRSLETLRTICRGQ